MKYFTLTILFATICAFSDRTEAASVIVTGQTAGPTPFIAHIQLTANPPVSVKSVKFQITPKAGSVTRPVSGTYPIQYLQKRGYFNSQTGAILLPVFGLYSNYSNTVNLTYTFTDNSTQPATVMVSTPAYSNPCGYTTPTVLQPRTNSTTLSYDYMLVKNHACGDTTPVVLDTDGQVRWIGTVGPPENPALLFQNSVYVGLNSILYRVELDGTFVALRDYASDGVTFFHHNADIGKRGILLEADTAAWVESVDLEVDGLGNILKTWNLADIITAAMTAGGDDATQFVQPAPGDWFHNNSVTYKRSDDSLIVSSRENFVIALDYTTGAIKWILGDTTKHWHQFPSLSNYALALGPNTLPPIGEHGLSITHDDNLLLFDNGRASLTQSPVGMDRGYSAPRKYQINTQTMVATELWNYEAGQAFNSPYCSSVYEDGPLNYVVDYAILKAFTPPQMAELLGLDASGTKIFHYRYSTNNCDIAFATNPIHFENVVFSVLAPPTAVSRKSHGGVGTFDIPLPLTGSLGVECRSGGAGGDYQIVTTFAVPVTITGAAVTPGSGGTGSVLGAPVLNGSGNEVTVNLTNVSNAQKITLNLIGVNDGSTTDNVSTPMGVLVGDTTGNRVVNSSDVSEVKLQTGSPVAPTTFRRDVTVSGSINSTDLSTVKAATGSSIPR